MRDFVRDLWRLTVRLVPALVIYTIVFVGSGEHLGGAGAGIVCAMVWLEWT